LRSDPVRAGKPVGAIEQAAAFMARRHRENSTDQEATVAFRP
jgi:hypothetical protein